MALREQFNRQGYWLFRWRSYLPIFFLILYIPVIAFHNHQAYQKIPFKYWDIFCISLSFLGLAIRIYTKGHAPRGTSGRNTKKQRANQLNTTGIYSVVRNPLYLGNYFIWLGIALLPQIYSWGIIFSLVFWLYYERVIFAEETFLREKFGENYLNWAKTTPAFIPNLKTFGKSDLSFRLKYVIKREHNGFFALTLTLVIMNLLRNLFYYEEVYVKPSFFMLGTIGFVTWISIRYLRKHTNLLKDR